MDDCPSFRARPTRLKEGIRPELAAICYPISAERARPSIKATHQFDKAHVVMLAERGIIPRPEAVQILRGFREMEKVGVEETRLTAGGHPHSGETYLSKSLDEEVTGWIHIGRSSADLVAVADRMTLRARLLDVMDEVIDFRAALLHLSEEGVETIMPGYSHIQHAQPVTLAHYALSWVCVLERSFERLTETYRRTDVCPAGAAVLTGSPFPMDVERTAELLGFGAVYDNTRDAVWGHDFMLEALAALAILANALGALAEDLNIWSTHEFGMVELADGFCINSSILPQKKNPMALQRLRGSSGIAMGNLVAALGIMKAPSDAAVWDRFFAYDTLWKACDEATGCLKLATAVLRTIDFKKDLMEERAGAAWAQAAELASFIVMEKGLTWRTAQQITSTLVRNAIDRGLTPQQVDTRMVDEAAIEYTGKAIDLSPETLAKAMDPRACVEAHVLRGGPAPSATKAEIPVHQNRMESDQKTVGTLRSAIAEGDRKLEVAIDSLLS